MAAPKQRHPEEAMVENIAAALARNTAVVIGPGLSGGKVWLMANGHEAGSFDGLAVARVLASSGDLAAFFKEKF